MAQQKKQVITTGNGFTEPILAGNVPTAEGLKQSRPSTSVGVETTKTVTVTEGLSQLQTLAVDLRGLNCEVSILAKGQMVYFIAKVPASIGILSMGGGHILAKGLPVSESMVKSSHNTAVQEPHIPK
jgi:hypothetical protein